MKLSEMEKRLNIPHEWFMLYLGVSYETLTKWEKDTSLIPQHLSFHSMYIEHITKCLIEFGVRQNHKVIARKKTVHSFSLRQKLGEKFSTYQLSMPTS